MAVGLGGLLGGALRLLGAVCIVLGLRALVIRFLSEGMLGGMPFDFDWPASLGLLALGALLVWLGRRH